MEIKITIDEIDHEILEIEAKNLGITLEELTRRSLRNTVNAIVEREVLVPAAKEYVKNLKGGRG